jgi:XTP/dITP diphosphohydrolase
VSSKSPLYFATDNPGKFREARQLLRAYGWRVRRVHAKLVEIQHDALPDIALAASRAAPASTPRPYFVEDSGLFIASLGGFPGPYSAYVFRKLGCEGVLRLLGPDTQREAVFRAAVAFQPRTGPPRIFAGWVNGTISTVLRGARGFGFDPIFVPAGETRTFAQLPLARKNALSHRARALHRLVRWLAAHPSRS